VLKNLWRSDLRRMSPAERITSCFRRPTGGAAASRQAPEPGDRLLRFVEQFD
jgi:hypothetical protein